MKSIKFIVTIFCAILFVACNETMGDASLIEGAWELRTTVSDASVYADYTGQTHYSEETTTHTYEEKDIVWLFYESHISWWSQWKDEESGQTHWSGYLDDAEHSYVVEGESPNMTIVETTHSIIPGMEDHSSVTRYHVEELTKQKMVLTTTATPYIADLGRTVDVHVTYTFKRENTLLNYVKQYWEK